MGRAIRLGAQAQPEEAVRCRSMSGASLAYSGQMPKRNNCMVHVSPCMESNYDILGIEEGSTQKDIRNAFRRLALQAHSDRGGESAKFIRIKQAYEDLKVGKKYPDTPLEKLRNSRVFSGDTDQEIRRRNQIIGKEVSAEMKEAQEWAGALRRTGITGTRMFGSKTLGEMEMEVKANGALHIKGNYMAGSITYDGPITMQGNISNPSWTEEFGTRIVVRRGDFKMVNPLENKYRIENGASVAADTGNIIVGNVFGRKYRVEDPDGRVGVYTTREYRTRLHAARGRVIAENAVNTVLLEGDTVMLLNMEDDVRVSAREVLVYGSKITYDCNIRLRRNGLIRFFEHHSIIGLSDDATISLENGKRLYLRDIKSRKIRDLADGLVESPGQYAKDATMVGDGFAITYDMLDSLVKDRGGSKGRWGIFGRG